MQSYTTTNNRDSRLNPAYERIDAGLVKVLSIDIFDTLLFRKTPIPEDVFLILGKKFKDENWLIEAVPAEAFLQMRVTAEQLARSKKTSEFGKSGSEVTLQEIYWNLSGIFTKITIEEMIQGKKGIFNESDIDELVNIEVALENQLLAYDSNIVQLIEYASQKGVSIVLVSNTYFSEKHITSFLQRENYSILPFISKMYISCEQGISKQFGLFSRVLEELSLHPLEVLHIGDNEVSDILAAKSESISTIFYQKYDKAFTQILKNEWPTNVLSKRQRYLDDQEGDFGLTSLRAKLRNHIVLKEMNKREAFFWNYGATVLAPFVMGFVHWIYDRCQAMGQSVVYCLMREGRLYADLIKEYAPYFPQHRLEVKELWISRRFIANACIFYGTAQELAALLSVHPSSKFTVDEFCSFLGLDITKIPKLLKYRYVRLDNGHNENRLCVEVANFLAGDQVLRGIILENAAAKRKRLLKYLGGFVDLTSSSQMTLVDVGWSGTIQAAIQYILQFSGSPTLLHGLYLGTNNIGINACLNSKVREGYLLKFGYPYEEGKIITRGQYALEQTATSNLGVLVDIDPQGNVITDKVRTGRKQREEALIVQQGIKAFCHQMGKAIQQGDVKWNSRSMSLTEQLRQIFVRATGLPTPEEATYFSKWQHDHMSGVGTSKHVLGNNQYYLNHIKDIVPEGAFVDWGMTWPSAYAAKESEALALVAQSVRSEILPKDCFLSEDLLPVKIFLDRGDGFSKKASQVVKMRSNANRSFYSFIRLESIKKPISQIRIEIDSPSSTIQIRSLRMMISERKVPDQTELIFFESDTNSEPVAASVPPFKPRIFACGKEPLSLIYRFEKDDVYLVHLNLCLEKFPRVV